MQKALTVFSPTNSANGALNAYCLWNPPFLGFSLTSPSEFNSISLSSPALTFFSLFFRGAFFLIVFAFFVTPPPRVARPLEFSCACSRAANFASSNSFLLLFLRIFFLGGASSSSEGEGDEALGEGGVIDAEADAEAYVLGVSDFTLVSFLTLCSVLMPFTCEAGVSIVGNGSESSA